MNFIKSEKTLEAILNLVSNKEIGALWRSGDGDANLVNGVQIFDCLSNQEASPSLIEEMREAMRVDHPNFLKTLPLYCEGLGLEDGMFPGHHQADSAWCQRIISSVSPFWGTFNNVYCHAALHFLAVIKPQVAAKFIKDFKENSGKIIFVGNKNTDQDVLNVLFGDNYTFLPTPPEKSYLEIDPIYDKLSSILTNEYTSVVTATGVCGRVIQKRLWVDKRNVFSLDIGSIIDGLCGFSSRAWIDLTKFDRVSFLDLIKSQH